MGEDLTDRDLAKAHQIEALGMTEGETDPPMEEADAGAAEAVALVVKGPADREAAEAEVPEKRVADNPAGVEVNAVVGAVPTVLQQEIIESNVSIETKSIMNRAADILPMTGIAEWRRLPVKRPLERNPPSVKMAGAEIDSAVKKVPAIRHPVIASRVFAHEVAAATTTQNRKR